MRLAGKQSRRSIEWMAQVKDRGGYHESFQSMTCRFDTYLSYYEDIFRSKTKYFFDTAKTYCLGGV